MSKDGKAKSKAPAMMRAMHLGSQRPLTFLVWIAFSIFVQNALTCALFHPIGSKPPQFTMEMGLDSVSVEASFVPHAKLAPPCATPAPLAAISAPQPIIESTAEAEKADIAPPPQEDPTQTTLSANRPSESAPVFSSETAFHNDPFEPTADTSAALTSITPNALPGQVNSPQKTQVHAASPSPPSIRRNPKPRYPEQARAMGQEGIVRLRVEIDEKGHSTAVSLLKGSGFPLLDDSACETVLKKWRFAPAVQNGRAIPGHLSLAIVFELKEA